MTIARSVAGSLIFRRAVVRVTPTRPTRRRLENIAWLTASQRRAILYDNASRFLRLDAQRIARHHGR